MPQPPLQSREPSVPPSLPAGPAPIPYAVPWTSPRNPAARPGTLTAVAILAIVLGGLSMLINGLGTVVMYGAYRESVPPDVAPPPPAVPLPPVNVAPHAGDYVSADGLKSAARSAAVAAVKQKVELNEDEAIMLDRFLADAGRVVFPAPPADGPDAARAPARSVRDAGREQAEAAAPAWFTTDAGRARIDDTSASFTPAGGGGAVRLSFNTFTDASGKQRWAAAAVDEWLDAVRANSSYRLSPYQATILADHLPAPDRTDQEQYGVREITFGFRTIPVRTLAPNVGPDGVLFARLRPSKDFLVLSDGRSVDAGLCRYGIDPVTGAALPPPTPPFKPMLPGSLRAIRLLVAEFLLSTLLGVGLAGSGLRTVTGNHATGRAFRGWAVARLCLSVCCFGLTVWYGATVGGSPAVLSAGSPAVGFARAVFALFVQCIFPVAVLCVMRSDAVRAYYAHWRHSADLVAPHVRRRFQALCASAAGRAALGAMAALGLAVAVGHVTAGAPKLSAPRPQVAVDLIGHAAGLGLALLALSTCVRLLLTARRATGAGPAAPGAGPAPAGVSLLLLATLAAWSAAPRASAQQKVLRVDAPKPAAKPDPATERFKEAERMLIDPNGTSRRQGASFLVEMGKPGRARIVRAIFEDPARPAIARDVAPILAGPIPYPFELLGCNPYADTITTVTDADWVAARKVMSVLVEHYTSIIQTPDVVKPTTAALRKLMDSEDAVLRRHASVTYFHRFAGDLPDAELMAMVLDSPHAEVRAAAAAAAQGPDNWLRNREFVRRVVPALDSDEPALRQLAVRAMTHRFSESFLTPREVLAALESRHKDVRDAATEVVRRSLDSDAPAARRYDAAIGLATAPKIRKLLFGSVAPARRAAARPWVLPPTPAPSPAPAPAPAAIPSGWLPGITAAFAAALATTFGALLAVAKLTAQVPPPPAPADASDDPQALARRAA